jgi:hypothetical protein
VLFREIDGRGARGLYARIDGRVVFAGKNSDADASSAGIYVREDDAIEPLLEPGDRAAGGMVQTAWLGRRRLDGTRVVIPAQLAKPDNSFKQVILVTDVATDVVFGDGFESATVF